jgi:glycosyltransferase involved in cell wall biosynthesis
MDDSDACGGGNPCSPSALSPLPTLSLVVPCYTPKRLDDIFRLFDSIASQTSRIDEVVVVVQQSRELMELLHSRLERWASAPIRLLFLDATPQVCMARNAALSEVNSDIIAFVDDDSALDEDWAAATKAFYCSRPDVIGTAGAILPLWDSPAMAWFPRELYWMLSCTYWTWTSPVPVRNGYGANMSFRREAFDGRRFSEACGIGAWGTGGWRGVGGEEPELALRVTEATGRPILYVPDIRVWHRVRAHRLRTKSLLRRAYWEGRLKAALSHRELRTPGVLHTEVGLLREMWRAQISRLRLLMAHPRLALRQQHVVLLAVTAVGLGFLEGRLRRERLKSVGDAVGGNGESNR